MRGDWIQSGLNSSIKWQNCEKTCKVSFTFWAASWSKMKDCDCNSEFSSTGLGWMMQTVWCDCLQSYHMLLCLLARFKVQQNSSGICCCSRTKISTLLIICGLHSEFCMPQQAEILKLARLIRSRFQIQIGNIWTPFSSLYTFFPSKLQHMEK